jgi:nicotinate-nucleotide adenylyltransferase
MPMCVWCPPIHRRIGPRRKRVRHSGLAVDTRELRREGPSYTRDTLVELRSEVPPERSIALLLGADAFSGLPTWHRWRELFDLAHVVVMTRPGHAVAPDGALADEVRARLTSDVTALQRSPSGGVLQLPVTPLEISASAVRDLLAAGRDPRWLVPDVLLRDAAILHPYRAACARSASPTNGKD